MPEPISVDRDARMCDSALARAFDFLGKRWNGVILGTLSTGPAGFSELKRAVTGISDSVLSERLTELAGAGIVERAVDAGPPVSVSYCLSASGLALLPALDELAAWASNNLTKASAPPR
jgi:DNA-binding HxlR family transcriptional regulator